MTRFLSQLLPLLLAVASSHAYNWECNLYCYNDGVCTHGQGKFGSYAQVVEDQHKTNAATTEGEDSGGVLDFTEGNDAGISQAGGMYCKCSPGFTGLQCEIVITVCSGTDKCWNGDECKRSKTDDGSAYFHCECDAEATDFTLHSYTPKYCEHIGRKFCDVRKGDSSIGSSSSYCGNGGRCLTKDDPDADLNSPVHHLGCECPKEFYGENCEHMYEEYMAGISPYGVRITADQKRKAKKIVGWVVGIICFVVILGVCLRRRQQVYLMKKRARRNKRRANRNKYPPAETDGSAMALKSGAQYA